MAISPRKIQPGIQSQERQNSGAPLGSSRSGTRQLAYCLHTDGLAHVLSTGFVRVDSDRSGSFHSELNSVLALGTQISNLLGSNPLFSFSDFRLCDFDLLPCFIADLHTG